VVGLFFAGGHGGPPPPPRHDQSTFPQEVALYPVLNEAK
jgi:hypothetical protein